MRLAILLLSLFALSAGQAAADRRHDGASPGAQRVGAQRAGTPPAQGAVILIQRVSPAGRVYQRRQRGGYLGPGVGGGGRSPGYRPPRRGGGGRSPARPPRPPRRTAQQMRLDYYRTGPRRGDVAAVQRALTALGYRPGAIDGRIGRRTIDAVMSWQRRKGLRADGKLGDANFARLLRDARGASVATGSGSGGASPATPAAASPAAASPAAASAAAANPVPANPAPGLVVRPQRDRTAYAIVADEQRAGRRIVRVECLSGGSSAGADLERVARRRWTSPGGASFGPFHQVAASFCSSG